MRPLSRVLAPIDLEAVAWEPLEYAGWLAARSGAIVDLFYALPTTGPSGGILGSAQYDTLVSVLALLTERFSSVGAVGSNDNYASEPVFVASVQPGDAVTLILEFAERGDHDVIVMGNRNHYPVSRLMGDGVAEQIVRRAHSPVLLIPDHRLEDETYSSPLMSI